MMPVELVNNWFTSFPGRYEAFEDGKIAEMLKNEDE